MANKPADPRVSKAPSHQNRGQTIRSQSNRAYRIPEFMQHVMSRHWHVFQKCFGSRLPAVRQDHKRDGGNCRYRDEYEKNHAQNTYDPRVGMFSHNISIGGSPENRIVG